LFIVRVRRGPLPCRLGVPAAALLAALLVAGCFNGTNVSGTSTTQGTLSTVAISVNNPVESVPDSAAPTAGDATEAPPDQGACSVRMETRPLTEPVTSDTTTDDTATAGDEVPTVIEWTGNGEASGFTFGGWLTEAEIVAIEAEGITVDRAQFNLSCVGGGGRVISLVGTNLIPQRPDDYPLRLAATGGQSARDKLLLNVSTVSDDVTAPRTNIWALAEAGTVSITTLDANRIVATINAEVVSVDTARSATLTAEFDFSRG
jgi:hypothetical protein